MKLNELSPAAGSKKKRKRIGRGPGSGHGGTSCKGHKGQKARSGASIRPGFEGGQMPLHRRIPKRGFHNIFKKEFEILNVKDLQRFEGTPNIDIEVLKKSGLIKSGKMLIKLLGDGEISFPVNIKVHQATKTAVEKIESSGGKVELLAQ
jgi:large subunit ribosomal protein L15